MFNFSYKILIYYEKLKIRNFSVQIAKLRECIEVRFPSLLFGGFTTMTVINPPEKKLANRTSVEWSNSNVVHTIELHDSLYI